MRALAVLLVVGFHYGISELSGGFIGVDVFFVISGFVITRMLRAEFNKRGTIDFLNFYGRRARRLLPGSVAMIIVTLAACAAVLSPFEMKAASKTAASASLYFSNFAFMARARDYFAPDSALQPFLHTWTLAVEEQFYLVWPAVILITSKLSRRRQLSVICAITFASFVASVLVVRSEQPIAFYASPLRAWEFGLGAIVTFMRPVGFPGPMAFAGIALIGVSAALLTQDTIFPGLTAAPATFGTAAVLLAGLTPNWASKWLEMKTLQWFGRLSYSIYLWHWPVLVIGKAANPDMGPLATTSCAALSLFLAWASFNYLEHPLRTNEWFAGHHLRSVRLGAALTMVGAAASASLWLFGEVEAREPDQLPIQLAAKQAWPIPLACLQNFTDTFPKPCSFLSGTRTMVLFGDSHAAQLFTPVMLNARASNMRLVTYLKQSCSVSDVLVFNNRLHRPNPECSKWRASSISDMRRWRPAIVVVSQSTMGYVKGLGRPSPTLANPRLWFEGTLRSLQMLAATGARVIVIQDTPRMSINVPTCLSRAASHGELDETCDRPRRLVVDEHLVSLESEASVKAGARYVRTSDLFCSENICPARRGNWILYRDGNHISEESAKRISPVLVRRLAVAEKR